MVRKLAFLALALLLTPALARADSVDFGFTGGTLSLVSGVLSSSGTPSALTSVDRNPWSPTPDFTGLLGAFALTTGTASGSLALTTIGSSTTLAGGGSITALANGAWGSIPAGTPLFAGTFVGPVTWTLTTIVGNNYFYNLTGNVTGTLDNSLIALLYPGGCVSCNPVNGSLFTLNISSTGAFSGAANIQSGNMSVVVPEPSTLLLFGSGLVTIAGIVRRRFVT